MSHLRDASAEITAEPNKIKVPRNAASKNALLASTITVPPTASIKAVMESTYASPLSQPEIFADGVPFSGCCMHRLSTRQSRTGVLVGGNSDQIAVASLAILSCPRSIAHLGFGNHQLNALLKRITQHIKSEQETDRQLQKGKQDYKRDRFPAIGSNRDTS